MLNLLNVATPARRFFARCTSWFFGVPVVHGPAHKRVAARSRIERDMKPTVSGAGEASDTDRTVIFASCCSSKITN